MDSPLGVSHLDLVGIESWSLVANEDPEKFWGDCDTHLDQGTWIRTPMTNGVGDEFGDQQC
jgi:hypothetical protein